MSATLLRPLPMPGLVGLVQVRSCVPNGVVKGEPRFRPPGTALQFTFWTRPISAQVAGLVPELMTPLPGNERYVAAMLPGRANASNAGVSYHPVEVTPEGGSFIVSTLKKKKILFFQIGPPMPPPR